MDHSVRLKQLHVQAKLGNVRKVKRLLEEEENIDDPDPVMNETPLHFAAWGQTDNHVELVKLLLSKGARVDKQNIHGKTALHKASRNNSCIIVATLLDHGADINNRATSGMTPLHDASLAGASDVVKMLLTRGADANAQDKSGETSAHMASTYGYISVLRHLLAYGANINLQTSEGLTPLHVACYAGDRNLPVVDFLLENNADVNIRTKHGDTALHKSVLRSYIHEPNKIYERLLERGACIDVRNDEGETPYDFCLIEDNDEKEIIIKTALEEHIVKLKTAGFTVRINLDTDSDEFKGFKIECVNELDKMKSTKVNELCSLDIVFLNVKNPWYLANLDTMLMLEETLSSPHFMKDFPLYGQILKNTFQKTKRRFTLLKKAFSSFSSGNRKQIWSLNLPDLVKLEILDYLSDDDLAKFSESG